VVGAGALRLTPVRKIYVAMFVVAISASALSALFPPYAQQAGFDVATVGFLVSVYAVLSLVSRLPAGALSSAGTGWAVSLGSTVLLAASYAAYALSTDFVALTTVRALNGLMYGVFTTVNMALLMEAIERPEQRASVTAWYLGWLAAGHAVGGFASGVLADAVGYQLAFAACALVGLAALPFVVTLPRGGARPAASRQPGERPVRQWRFMFSLPLLVAALQGFAVNAFSHLIWTFYLLYGVQVGLSLTMLGIHRGSYSTSSMVTRPLVGPLSRHVSYNALATWGLVLTAAVSLLVPFLTAFWPLLVLNVVLGGLRAAALVGSMVAAVEFGGTDPRKRGVAAGVYSFASDAANMLTPFVGGLIADRIGLGATFWVMSIGLIALYLALLAISVIVERRRGALAASPGLR
jgi:MFS transporter, DHA1 family, multidrug resistance protein